MEQEKPPNKVDQYTLVVEKINLQKNQKKKIIIPRQISSNPDGTM